MEHPLVCHPYDLAHDPAVGFAAGGIVAAIVICLLLLAIGAIWPEGRPKRRPKRPPPGGG